VDLSDEDAVSYFQTLIYESLSAFFPKLMEAFHNWAQAVRA